MHRIKSDKLRGLLYRQASVLSEEALKSEGQISDKQVKVLERLAQLVKICNAAKPPPKRWPVLVVLGVTLLILSILLFSRVSETEIELDMALSEVNFTSSSQQVLSEAIGLSELGVLGLREIQLSRARGRTAEIFGEREYIDAAIRLSKISDGNRQSTIMLGRLELSPETRVRLRHKEVLHQYRLSLEGKDLKLRAEVNGTVQVNLPGIPEERLQFSSPRSIKLRPNSKEVNLDLTFSGTSKQVFSPQLSVENLSFIRIDEIVGTEHTVVKYVSTILSGKLYFESLGGQVRTIRPGEAIRFETSSGQMRTIQLHNNHLSIKFRGQVSGMSTGIGESSRSLMPTCLEWLKARHGLALLWGTTLYLFGLGIGILRWWKLAI
jgi:hypothetical protein